MFPGYGVERRVRIPESRSTNGSGAGRPCAKTCLTNTGPSYAALSTANCISIDAFEN